jgi:hypothetical protein
VEVFNDHDYGVLLGQCAHEGQDRFEGALPLLLGRQRSRGIALGGQWQRHEVRERGQRLIKGKLDLRQEEL